MRGLGIGYWALLASLFAPFVGSSAPVPAQEALGVTLLRHESFALSFAGESHTMGRAEWRELERPAQADGPAERVLEFVWHLDLIQTRVDQFVRQRGANATVSYREWRSDDGGDRFTGRTLVMERQAGTAEIREWAGDQMGHRWIAVGQTEMELVQAARAERLSSLRLETVFSPLDGEIHPVWVQAIVLPTWGGLLPGCRQIVHWDLTTKRPLSEWWWLGSHLIGFRIGEIVGKRVPQRPSGEIAIDEPHAGL